MGLAKGGNLDNAIVVDKDTIINNDGLRNKKNLLITRFCYDENFF